MKKKDKGLRYRFCLMCARVFEVVTVDMKLVKSYRVVVDRTLTHEGLEFELKNKGISCSAWFKKPCTSNSDVRNLVLGELPEEIDLVIVRIRLYHGKPKYPAKTNWVSFFKLGQLLKTKGYRPANISELLHLALQYKHDLPEGQVWELVDQYSIMLGGWCGVFLEQKNGHLGAGSRLLTTAYDEEGKIRDFHDITHFVAVVKVVN